MCEERGFRAPLKWAPETGVTHSYQCRPQRWAWDAKAAAATNKKPVCEHRSLSTPPLPGAGAARHFQGPVIQGQLPRENARHASGWCIVMPASATTGSPSIRTLPSPWPEWARAPEAATPLTPPCLSEEQTPSGDLHAEAGPNPKLNPGSCANKEEKGKFLPAASGAEDYISTINLMYPASVEYLNKQWINPNWWGGLWEQWYIYFFPFFSFCECVCICFCVWFWLYSFAFTICPRVLTVHYWFSFCFFQYSF